MIKKTILTKKNIFDHDQNNQNQKYLFDHDQINHFEC